MLHFWVGGKRITNKELKEKIMHNIDVLDKKEEKLDLSLMWNLIQGES